jgi:tetratricopeptide (TPR) repeat protein
MRNIVAISILLISFSFCKAGSLDSLYNQAGTAYEAGNFEEALALYKEIIEEGFESPELYYNMGNSAFRSNKLGYSILYYEKALKLDPSNQEVRKNLSFVSIYKEDQLESVPEFFLKRWINTVYSWFSVSIWSYLSLLFFGLLLLGTITYIFASSLATKKSGFFMGVISLLLFLIAFSGALRRNKEIKDPDSAVVISPSVVVKSSPSISGTDLFILHEGTLIRVDDEVGEWVEIKISDGRVGWIPIETHAII